VGAKHNTAALAALALAAITAANAPVHAAGPAGAAACTGCHSASAAASPFRRLAGLDAAGIVKAMQDYRAGRRPATVMDRISRGYSDEEIQDIADWYARQR